MRFEFIRSFVVSRVVVGAAFALGIALSAGAETDEQPPDWRPPADSQFDWLKLSSGEWIKGDMEGLRDRKISFDSDKLDDLSIDWDDVAAMYLRRPHIFRFESGESAQGLGVLRDDVLSVTTAEGATVEQPRDQIVSIIEGDGTEWDYWSGYLGADVALREGNVDQTDLSGRAGLKRETASTRWMADYRGFYSSVNDAKTDNNHRATSTMDFFLTSRLYWTIPFVEYFRDEFQNLENRVTAGSLVGYEFVRNKWAELDVALGGAYQYTKYDEAQPGTSDDSGDPAAVLNMVLQLDLPRDVELDNLYRLQVPFTNTNLISHHFESILSADVWGPLDLDVTFMLDRTEKPERDSNGRRPDSQDIRILAGLSVDF